MKVEREERNKKTLLHKLRIKKNRLVCLVFSDIQVRNTARSTYNLYLEHKVIELEINVLALINVNFITFFISTK